jgi:hypothetical protein
LLIAQFARARDNGSRKEAAITEGTRRSAATLVAAGAAALLLVDLFLDWQKSAVEVAGIVNIESTVSGWHGWGFLAGFAALVLMALVATAATPPVFNAGAAIVVLTTTSLAVFAGSADAPLGPAATVDASTLWAAWVGLVLAVVAFCAALVPLVAPPPTPYSLTPHETV